MGHIAHPERLVLLVAALVLIGEEAGSQPVAWRFGLDDTHAHLGGILSEADAHRLLEKMAGLSEPQAEGGAT